eukprot:gene56473-36264_t
MAEELAPLPLDSAPVDYLISVGRRAPESYGERRVDSGLG